jgi:8-oxo-dGTP pyrophosphatase MutT (NUDIX family)
MALAAVLVPVMDHPRAPTVLLTRRSTELPDHPGQISFPGGRLEPEDRDATAAALREASEEIGLPADRVEVLGYLPAHMTLTGFAVTPVVALVTPGFEFRLDAREVAQLIEIPLSFLADSQNQQFEERVVSGRTLRLPVFHYEGHRVWGATAIMLAEFCGRVARQAA